MRPDADKLVDGANFAMGINQVHEIKFGAFQLLANNGAVFDMLYVNGVIENIKKFLNEKNQ